MSNIPKTRVRRALDRYTDPSSGLTRYRWEVTFDGHTLVQLDNHRVALGYARSYAKRAQRQHVEKLERAAYEARRAAEKGTPEKRVQMHNTPPQRGSWIWINRDDVDAPKVKPGDHVTVEVFGRPVSGTVTRCDEDGITIREERW